MNIADMHEQRPVVGPSILGSNAPTTGCSNPPPSLASMGISCVVAENDRLLGVCLVNEAFSLIGRDHFAVSSDMQLPNGEDGHLAYEQFEAMLLMAYTKGQNSMKDPS